ncbi:MAG TPA: ATP-dependent Clp protease adapter ClpS [Gammaproteobacteria bacterium]|nr:ATP-dependent Clp protease adapter ClpS [Gammaproteobacteria bacterium]
MSKEKRHENASELLLEAAKPQLKRPSMYSVIMLNDDYTPMEFVIHVLESFFHMTAEVAVKVMLDVHHKGRAHCGTYSRDVAETKVAQVINFARRNDHPLLCKIEKI